MLDPLPPDVHEFLGGLYAEVSPHGADHWPDVWARLDAEHHRARALTTDDLTRIATRSLLMFADDETEVAVEHIHAMQCRHDRLDSPGMADRPPLSRPGRVSEPTAPKVRRAARRLGDPGPHPGARSLPFQRPASP